MTAENESSACELCGGTDDVQPMPDQQDDTMNLCGYCRAQHYVDSQQRLVAIDSEEEVEIHEGDVLDVTLGTDGSIESIEAGPATENGPRVCERCGRTGDVQPVTDVADDTIELCIECHGKAEEAWQEVREGPSVVVPIRKNTPEEVRAKFAEMRATAKTESEHQQIDLCETLAGLAPLEDLHKGRADRAEEKLQKLAAFSFDAAEPGHAAEPSEQAPGDAETLDQIAAVLRTDRRDALAKIRDVVLATGREAWPRAAGGTP